jgi:hypothetical protein
MHKGKLKMSKIVTYSGMTLKELSALCGKQIEDIRAGKKDAIKQGVVISMLADKMLRATELLQIDGQVSADYEVIE